MQGKSNKLSGEIQSIGGPTPFLCIFISFYFSFPRVVSPICLSPCFRLLRLYTGEQNNGSLEEIDALLGMGVNLEQSPSS